MRPQVAIAPTLLIAVIYRHRRGTELDQLNELVNVLQSIQLPFALLPARPTIQQNYGGLRVASPSYASKEYVGSRAAGTPPCFSEVI